MHTLLDKKKHPSEKLTHSFLDLSCFTVLSLENKNAWAIVQKFAVLKISFGKNSQF